MVQSKVQSKTGPKEKDKKLHLKVEKRNVFGKKLKKMRIEGKLPANIFGPGYKSQSISIDTKDFKKVFKTVKETGIVYLKLDSSEIPVLVRGVQKHPVSGDLLHVDLRKIDLKQKIETKVPIEVLGESPAVTQKGGVLLTHINEVAIEALPEDIPSKLSIDITGLVDIGNEIKISGLVKSDKYTIKEDENKAVVSVIEHKEESLVAETAPTEAPEVIEGKPEEAVEGEEGVEGAEKPVGEKEETKTQKGEEKPPAEEQKQPEQKPKQPEEKNPKSQNPSSK
jgi:large subunit ribosomal protein L25